MDAVTGAFVSVEQQEDRGFPMTILSDFFEFTAQQLFRLFSLEVLTDLYESAARRMIASFRWPNQ